MTELKALTKFQKQALFNIAYWCHEYGGLATADGRSAQTLIKRGWVENCVRVKTTSGGVMSAEMRYVITREGRQAAHELGWKPGLTGYERE